MQYTWEVGRWGIENDRLIFGWGGRHGWYGSISLLTGELLWEPKGVIELHQKNLNGSFCSSIHLVTQMTTHAQTLQSIEERWHFIIGFFGSVDNQSRTHIVQSTQASADFGYYVTNILPHV